MLIPIQTNQFKKDVKLIIKRNKDIHKLKLVMSNIVEKKESDAKFRKHKLVGIYKDRWECHIEPDWLLIYLENKYELTYSHD